MPPTCLQGTISSFPPVQRGVLSVHSTSTLCQAPRNSQGQSSDQGFHREIPLRWPWARSCWASVSPSVTRMSAWTRAAGPYWLWPRDGVGRGLAAAVGRLRVRRGEQRVVSWAREACPAGPDLSRDGPAGRGVSPQRGFREALARD